jgi:hypothetical protein
VEAQLDRRRPARVAWAVLWSALVWPLFVGVTVLTLSLWVVDPDYTETTPVGDLSFFALGAMTGAGFASQVRRHPPAAGVGQALVGAAALTVCGLLGGRVEPLAGGGAGRSGGRALGPAPAAARAPAPARHVLHCTAVGVGYAAVLLSAARAAGPSCFLGQCAHGDRLAEMAATALAVPALAALAAWRVDGWRLPLWSAGLGAVTVGASSSLLPHAPGSLGLLGGTATMTWGALFVAVGEHGRHHTRHPHTRKRENP